MHLRGIGRDLGTGPDGRTHDVARWMAIASTITAIGLTAYSVVYNPAYVWSITDFGLGMGSLFTGTGILIKAKESSEPSAAPTPL